MTFRFADYTKQVTGAGIGTGAFVFTGTPTGFAAFSAIPGVANGDLVPYSAWDGAGNREVGIATYNTGGSLTRTTILRSTNSNAAVSFSAAVTVWCDAPAAKLPLLDQNNALVYAAAAAASNAFQVSQNYNGTSTVWAENTDGGTAANIRVLLNNGTHNLQITMFGTGFTTSGASRQDGVVFSTNGAGGMGYLIPSDAYRWFIGATQKVLVDTSNLDASNLTGKFAALLLNGINLTGTSSGSGGSLTGQGSITLPGGLILKFGNVLAPGPGGTTITFPTPFPNDCLSSWGSPYESGTQQFSISTFPHNASQMELSSNITGAYVIGWFAIGR